VSKYQILVDGTAVGSDFYDALSSVEVEENADMPDALRLRFPVSTKDKDLTWVNDPKLQPFANVAVVITDEKGATQCIFDGYVLAAKVHLEAGITASTLEVTGQDASVLMQLEEKSREFVGMTHGDVANTLFGEHGFGTAAHNSEDDSPAATEETHTLMQRGSDLEFLQRLARRTSRWCRVACGATAGDRVGYFAPPHLEGDPVLVLNLNDAEKRQVKALDFVWDVARPNKVAAQQASLSDTEAVKADTGDSGLPALDARDLRTFAGRDRTVMLTAAADDPELPGRARAVLRDAGWFASCEGTANLAVTKIVLRAADLVTIEGVGKLLSGKHLVRRVRHTITADSHEMAFTLIRNAVGPRP
jgi:phage protein D